jgi:hypothetical protein
MANENICQLEKKRKLVASPSRVLDKAVDTTSMVKKKLVASPNKSLDKAVDTTSMVKKKMYELEEGEFLVPKNVAKCIDELVAFPHGGLNKAGGTPSRYLELLVYTLKTGNLRNQSIVMTTLLETRHKSVLQGIIKADGMHVFSYMLNQHQHSFEMTPIVRLTLRVLQHLESHAALPGDDLTCSSPNFCAIQFSQTLFQLTKHSDSRVRTLASTFQKLRFCMPRVHPSHNQCKEAS